MMKAMIDGKVLDLRKVKKSSTCLPSFFIHLSWSNKFLTQEETESYDRLKSIYRFAKPDSDFSSALDDV